MTDSREAFGMSASGMCTRREPLLGRSLSFLHLLQNQSQREPVRRQGVHWSLVVADSYKHVSVVAFFLNFNTLVDLILKMYRAASVTLGYK